MFKQQDNEEESEEESEEDDEEWERVGDLKRFLFEAGLEVAGPDKNPEQEVYAKFQSKMGVDTADWVSMWNNFVIIYIVTKKVANILLI